MKKSRQLSLFNDSQVERNGLCRAFVNPPKDLLKKLRMEAFYKIKTPGLLLEEWVHDNIIRHVKGGNIEKVGRRYFYN